MKDNVIYHKRVQIMIKINLTLTRIPDPNRHTRGVHSWP